MSGAEYKNRCRRGAQEVTTDQIMQGISTFEGKRALVLVMSSLRCLLHIQVEMHRRKLDIQIMSQERVMGNTRVLSQILRIQQKEAGIWQGQRYVDAFVHLCHFF